MIQINDKEAIMRRKVTGRLFLLAPGKIHLRIIGAIWPAAQLQTAQSESSQSRSFTSRFQRVSLSGLVRPSTFSSALRFVSTSARA